MSLFKRLLNPNYKSEEKVKKPENSDHSSYYPEQKLPIDEKFTYNFKNNGGKFIYCENWEEVTEAFDNIMIENDWYEQDVFCINEHLCQKFDGFNLNFGKKHRSKIFSFRLRIAGFKQRLHPAFLKPNKGKEIERTPFQCYHLCHHKPNS